MTMKLSSIFNKQHKINFYNSFILYRFLNIDLSCIKLINLQNVSSKSSFDLHKNYEYKDKITKKENKKYTIDDDDKERSELKVSSINSLRIDMILKTAFGLSRNKIEKSFYAGEILKNGRKIIKKSEKFNIDDEIDLISNRSQKNPNFLIVSRIKILNVTLENNLYNVMICLEKNLLVENETYKT